MRNLYEVINNFNKQFGHNGKITGTFIRDEDKVYFEIEYPDIPTPPDKLKCGYIHRKPYQHGMCCLHFSNNNMYLMKVGNFNSIYTTDFAMCDSTLRSKLNEISQHRTQDKDMEPVYVSNKLIHKLITYCKDHIMTYKKLIYTYDECDDKSDDELRQYTEALLTYIKMRHKLEEFLVHRQKGETHD